MDFIFGLIPFTGMVLVLFVAPALALVTLVLAAVQGKMSGLLLSLGYFIGYLLWFGAEIALFLTFPPINYLPWWLPFFMLWLSFASIPHAIILIRAKREKKRLKLWVGILGVSTTVLATFGIQLLFYSARFY